MTTKAELFLGRLPAGMTPDQLRPIFEPFGEVLDIRMLPGNKNCGFVTFRSFGAAETALNALLTAQPLGPDVNAQWAGSKNGSVVMPAASAQPMEKKVFVGSLMAGVQEADLFNAFSACGRVLEAKVLNSNPEKPCGFVSYESFQEAEAAIEQLHNSAGSGLSRPGETLTVKWAEGRGKLQQQQQPTQLPRAFIPQGSPMSPSLSSLSIPIGVAPGLSWASAPSMSAAAALPGVMPHPCGSPHGPVFFGGLPEDISEDTLRGMVAMFGGVTSVKIYRKDSSAPPCGFVTFQLHEQAQSCIDTYNGSDAGAAAGKVLTVKWADSKRAVAAPNAMALASIPPAQDKIFIGGLPLDASEDFLKGMMVMFGRGLTSCRIWRKDAASPPCGFVTFATPEQGQHCIDSLNGNEAGAAPGKSLTVKWADSRGVKRSAPEVFSAPMESQAWAPPIHLPRVMPQARPPAMPPITSYGAPSFATVPAGFGGGRKAPTVFRPGLPCAPAEPSRSSGPSVFAPSSSPVTGRGGVEKVFVGGLPKTVSQLDLEAVAASYGLINSVPVMHSETKPSCALLQFNTVQEAEAMIQALNGVPVFDEKALVVKFAQPVRNAM